MSDANQTKVIVHGAPHPLTRAAFDYLKAILDAANGPLLELVTIARDPLTIAGERGVYLRSNTVDTLALQRPERPDAELAQRLPMAVLRRLDTRWRDFSTLQLSEVAQSGGIGTDFLAEVFDIHVDARTITAAAKAFLAFKACENTYGDPFAYLDALGIDGAEDDIVMPAGRICPTFACESGVPHLIDGWMTPDMDGCWLVEPRATMCFYLRERAGFLTCIFQPLPVEIAFLVLVDGKPAEAIVRHEEVATLLLVRLGPPVKAARTWPSSIELFINDPTIISKTGIKLRALRFDPIQARNRPNLRTRLPWTLGDAGFIRGAIAIGSGHEHSFTPPLSVEHLFNDRPDCRKLIVAGATSGLDPASLMLPMTGVILHRDQGTNNVYQEGDVPTPVNLLTIGAGDEFPTMEAMVDQIHFHHVGSKIDAASLLIWAEEQLSFRGLLSGVESSAEAAAKLLAGMTKRIGRRSLTFIVEGPNWVAVPVTYWKH